jgi:ABC-type lipoprotein release transport system permease subunit
MPDKVLYAIGAVLGSLCGVYLAIEISRLCDNIERWLYKIIFKREWRP